MDDDDAAVVALTTADFLVGKILGEGRFATVFHCCLKPNQQTHHTQQKRLLSLAVKVIGKCMLEKHEGMRDAVLCEQRILKRLTRINHKQEYKDDDYKDDDTSSSPPWVVPLLASFHDSQCVYLVLEYAPCTLTHLMRKSHHRHHHHHGGYGSDSNSNEIIDHRVIVKHHSTMVVVHEIGLQLVRALQFIHSHSIIHCDIKPDNILITTSGNIQLCDFGSALDLSLVFTTTESESPIVLDESQSMNMNVQSVDTTSPTSPYRKMIIPRGTPDYASPELIRGVDSHSTLTFATDLWSFGCTLFALLSMNHGEGESQSPFHSSSEALIVDLIMQYCTHPVLHWSNLYNNNNNNNNNNNDDDDDDDSTEIGKWKRLVGVLLDPEPHRRWMWGWENDNDNDEVCNSRSPCALHPLAAEPPLQQYQQPKQKQKQQQQPTSLSSLNSTYINVQYEHLIQRLQEWRTLACNDDSEEEEEAVAATARFDDVVAAVVAEEESSHFQSTSMRDGSLGWSAFYI